MCGSVRSVAPETTIVRASWFAQNFSESFFVDGVREGELALRVDGVSEPFVDAEDIADVVVAALTERGHGGSLYEVTGPRLLTSPTRSPRISTATGQDVRFVPVPAADYAGAITSQGVPAGPCTW